MKIGITERGDAGINLEWIDKINKVDGAILITKEITPNFIKSVLSIDKPIIVHATCTGLGGTALEPFVPNYKIQLTGLKQLIDNGFPSNHCVLRIDPIIPIKEGFEKIAEMLKFFETLNLGISRFRVSIMDEYPHVRQRFINKGFGPLYGQFSASAQQFEDTKKFLEQYPYTFETCAEPKLLGKNIKASGCISPLDLELMGLKNTITDINGQNRQGCLCLNCKTELLSSRHPCAHQCAYCFWKDE